MVTVNPICVNLRFHCWSWLWESGGRLVINDSVQTARCKKVHVPQKGQLAQPAAERLHTWLGFKKRCVKFSSTRLCGEYWYASVWILLNVLFLIFFFNQLKGSDRNILIHFWVWFSRNIFLCVSIVFIAWQQHCSQALNPVCLTDSSMVTLCLNMFLKPKNIIVIQSVAWRKKRKFWVFFTELGVKSG